VRDGPATHIANAVGALIQLRQCSFGAIQSTLERLTNTDVRQAAHRLRRAIADPLPEADGAAPFGPLCQYPQPLAVTVPARFQLSANCLEVEIIGAHRTYPTPGAILARNLPQCLVSRPPRAPTGR
jgi:hypothetical protein